jgi:hypothetical protein
MSVSLGFSELFDSMGKVFRTGGEMVTRRLPCRSLQNLEIFPVHVAQDQLFLRALTLPLVHRDDLRWLTTGATVEVSHLHPMAISPL